MMTQSLYQIKLTCGHIQDWSDWNDPPTEGVMHYCEKCRRERLIVSIYCIQREIEDIEEMMG